MGTSWDAGAYDRTSARSSRGRRHVLELALEEPVDAIVSTAALHWIADHDRMWSRLAKALRPGGVLEIQCGGEGNIARVRDAVARDGFEDLVG